MTGGRHPVRGQFDIGQFLNAGGGDIGDGFAYGHAPAGRRVNQGNGRTLSHGHGFAGNGVITAGGHGHIGDRYLPWPHHLITADETGHAAITDGNQKCFVGNGWEPQNPVDGLININFLGLQTGKLPLYAFNVTYHFRRFAQKNGEFHINRLRGAGDIHVRGRKCGVLLFLRIKTISQQQSYLFCRLAQYRHGTALAYAQGAEGLQLAVVDGQNIALLCLVAPDFHR